MTVASLCESAAVMLPHCVTRDRLRVRTLLLCPWQACPAGLYACRMGLFPLENVPSDTTDIHASAEAECGSD